jgi:hypothetical protein
MAQHFADCLNRHTIHQSDGSGESMAGEVGGQVFLNSTDFGEDLQTSVYLLIAYTRENSVALANVPASNFSK